MNKLTLSRKSVLPIKSVMHVRENECESLCRFKANISEQLFLILHMQLKMTPGHYSMGSLFFLIGSTLRLLRVSLFILCYFGNPTKKKTKRCDISYLSCLLYV